VFYTTQAGADFKVCIERMVLFLIPGDCNSPCPSHTVSVQDGGNARDAYECEIKTSPAQRHRNSVGVTKVVTLHLCGDHDERMKTFDG